MKEIEERFVTENPLGSGYCINECSLIEELPIHFFLSVFGVDPEETVRAWRIRMYYAMRKWLRDSECELFDTIIRGYLGNETVDMIRNYGIKKERTC
jgi:hypothetical protein